MQAGEPFLKWKTNLGGGSPTGRSLFSVLQARHSAQFCLQFTSSGMPQMPLCA